MDPAGGPLSASERPADEAAAWTERSLPPAKRRRLAERLERGLDASDRWLHLLQDCILVAVALLMLAMGVVVLVDGARELVGIVTVHVGDEGTFTVDVESGRATVEVAENALLALILAELVGTLLLSLRGKPLTIEPFLAIAIVAVVRHLLFATVGPSADPVTHTIELLGLGGLILLLVGAVVLLRRGQVPKS
ncbi:MAG TPA: phosphate-starvation-inducible PsiE family protein [Chloroflexota bacterium]|nr:phosphate-starvation-inducible PsiE family protein [Chloroflexota bacterium]